MNEEQMQDPNSPSSRATAVSIFEQSNGMNDFPVLKAFQEYIDAEQARARKRMLGLSIFFVTLLVVVVVTFSVIMAAVINRDQQNLSAIATRNQELSDKLLDIALRERTPVAQPVVTVQQPAPQPAVQPPQAPDQTAVLKPMIERLEQLAAKINQPQPPPVQQVAPAPVQTAPVESPEVIRQRQERQEMIEVRRQREAIAAERAKLKEEQEKLRLQQIEQHRRRLYPEFYAQEEARKKAEEEAKRAPTALPKSSVPPSPAKPVVEPMKQVAPITSAPEKKQPITPASVVKTPEAKVVEQPKAAIDHKAISEAKPVDLKSAKPISYFDQDDDDAPAAPAVNKNVKKGNAKVDSPSPAPEAKEKTTQQPAPKKTETINVGAQGNDQIPWLIELPEKK